MKCPINIASTLNVLRCYIQLKFISNFYKMASISSKLSTAKIISFENQPLAILKICPPNITLLQKTKNSRISKTK